MPHSEALRCPKCGGQLFLTVRAIFLVPARYEYEGECYDFDLTDAEMDDNDLLSLSCEDCPWRTASPHSYEPEEHRQSHTPHGDVIAQMMKGE